MKKRVLAMICSIALCFALLTPAMANAQDNKIIGSAGDECYYVFDRTTGVMKIYPCSYAEGDVNVWHNMFMDVGTQVKKVIIADGITGIEGTVFAGWSNLESVEMPDSVTFISYAAFVGCNSLKGGLVIPKNVTSIREYAFGYCESMDELTFDGSAPEYIHEEAFAEVTANVYYDAADSTWTDKKNNYGGNLTWLEKPEKADGAWLQDGNGWWWKNNDGSYPANQWKLINDEWYFFDAAGYMKTGWLAQGNTWYYLEPSGAMATGWLDQGGTWYYLDESGAMKTGWTDIAGKWYYLASSGAMKTGWLNQGGTWYYLESNGAMATGWEAVGDKWYYFDASGAMATGWVDVDGTWYYLQSSGAMAANQWIGNYYVLSSGAMATSQWVGNYYVGADGAWIPGYR